MSFTHKPVLLKEVADSMTVKDPAVYVDLTSGGGGHAEKIIARFPLIRAILIDRDEDAVVYLKNKFKGNKNVTVVKSSFSNIDKVLYLMKVDEADIILADLGVSSHQFDTAERGFSVRKEGPFDMRMDADSGITALEYIKTTEESIIKEILSKYAQERESLTMAKVLKKCAAEGKTTTSEFADAIRKAKRYSKSGIDPATQVFMALRMVVNDEIGELEKMLKKSFFKLSQKGVMGVITFHSTEDRVVKQFFKERKNKVPYYVSEDDMTPYSCPEVAISELVYPTESEIDENPRSRSAKLRLISKSSINFNKRGVS